MAFPPGTYPIIQDYWTSAPGNPLYEDGVFWENPKYMHVSRKIIPIEYRRTFTLDPQSGESFELVKVEASKDITAQINALKKLRPNLEVEIRLRSPEWDQTSVTMIADYFVTNIADMTIGEITLWECLEEWYQKHNYIMPSRDMSHIITHIEGRKLTFTPRPSNGGYQLVDIN